MKTGIYFNRTKNEVMSVTDGDARPGPEWLHLSDEPRLGLLAIRELVKEAGLVADLSEVYWHLPQVVEEAPALSCDPPPVPLTKRGPIARLNAILRGPRRPPFPVG